VQTGREHPEAGRDLPGAAASAREAAGGDERRDGDENAGCMRKGPDRVRCE